MSLNSTVQWCQINSLYSTLKAKQIQPDDGLEKGRDM
jgi:hypothetical protein